MTETLTINGVPLDTYAFLVTDISGIMVSPEKRGENVVVPGRHGRIRSTNKRFDSVDIVLPMWVNGSEADGTVPSGSTARGEWFKRRDELLRLLSADPLRLEFTRPDGHAVNVEAEFVTTLAFETIGVQPEAQVSVGLTLNEFWQDAVPVSQTISGPSGTIETLTAFEGATAPMADLLITFTGEVNNPMLTHGDRWVQWNGVVEAGQQLVLNTSTWRPSPGTGTTWAPDFRMVSFGPGPTFFELDPTVAPFEIEFSHTGGVSASCTVAGRRKYLQP